MSRGTATWLFCTAAVFLLGLFDLDCPRTKQLTLAFGVLVLPKGEEDTESWPIDWLYSCLQYWWIALGISSVLCVFVLARINSLPSSDAPAWRGPGKVLLFPCKTTHARLFPKRHSFAYSYLVVGIPVGWEGNCGGMVSSFPADDANSQTWFSTPRDKAYYHVNPDDYLQRGGGHLGLRRKLDAYLKTQVCLAIHWANLSSSRLFLTSQVGSRSRRLSPCLPGHRRKILGLSLQSRLFLVPLWRGYVFEGHDIRGQQHF